MSTGRPWAAPSTWQPSAVVTGGAAQEMAQQSGIASATMGARSGATCIGFMARLWLRRIERPGGSKLAWLTQWHLALLRSLAGRHDVEAAAESRAPCRGMSSAFIRWMVWRAK